MSRFAFKQYDPDLSCSKHGTKVIGVSRDPDAIGWTSYCEDCAADLILKTLTPLQSKASSGTTQNSSE